MLETAEHLMSGCGFNVVYGYTQSDEISLLFGPEENGFGRKLRKLISVLAGEASARFSLLLGAMACFDCRISPAAFRGTRRRLLPLAERGRPPQRPERPLLLVLRKQGTGVGEATAAMRGVSVADKNELLFATALTSTTCHRGRGGASGCTGKSTTGRPRIR